MPMPLEGWEPGYEELFAYAVIIAVVCSVASAALWWRDRRSVRVARQPGQVTTMRARVYSRWRWILLRPHNQSLVGLWPEGLDPSGEPPISFVISPRDVERVQAGAVTVYGRAEPGQRVILEAGGRFVWPESNLREGLPKQAKPASQ